MEMGVAFLSEQAMPEDNQMILREMTEAVHRANDVITGLMDLSPRELGTHEADLLGVIERALAALGTQLAEAKIEVVREFGDALPTSPLDEGKIEQVLLNVFTNALHAMPEGGCLTIKTSVKVLGAGDVAFNAGDRSGARFREGERALVIEVSDTGSGIAPEHLNKVFEPFFSTKPTGKGMGLGLTVVRKIVELHRGTIVLRNREDGGVMVTMMFKTT
jgi:signal transduction histidine kinase